MSDRARRASYTRTNIRPNSFNERGRRNAIQILHDVLVAAKDGMKKTNLMSAANANYKLASHLLECAQRAGFIENVEVAGRKKYWRGKPTFVWKTTDKGLEWARRVWEDYELVTGIVE